MLMASLRSIAYRLRADPSVRYLYDARGIIHVGASGGQEAELYAKFDQPVLWIEPLPSAFDVLKRTVAAYPRQRAVHRLIADSDGAQHILHVASNHGMSSSILAPERHREMWPEVNFDTTLQMRSVTLDSLVDEVGCSYEALVVDTQGAELLVLKGAQRMLRRIKYVKAEAADFESYAGCAKVEELEAFLSERGFKLLCRQRFADKPGVGSYYELLFGAGG
jgi:FkbM family methyltransferase